MPSNMESFGIIIANMGGPLGDYEILGEQLEILKPRIIIHQEVQKIGGVALGPRYLAGKLGSNFAVLTAPIYPDEPSLYSAIITDFPVLHHGMLDVAGYCNVQIIQLLVGDHAVNFANLHLPAKPRTIGERKRKVDMTLRFTKTDERFLDIPTIMGADFNCLRFAPVMNDLRVRGYHSAFEQVHGRFSRAVTYPSPIGVEKIFNGDEGTAFRIFLRTLQKVTPYFVDGQEIAGYELDRIMLPPGFYAKNAVIFGNTPKTSFSDHNGLYALVNRGRDSKIGT